MNNRTKVALAGLSAVCTTLAISPAIGQPPNEPVVVHGQLIDPELQRRVPYGDLNLASKPGQQRLMWRVDAAVDDLCDASVDNRPLSMEMQSRACSKFAWASAKPQIRTAIDLALAGDPRKVAINISLPPTKVASK